MGCNGEQSQHPDATTGEFERRLINRMGDDEYIAEFLDNDDEELEASESSSIEASQDEDDENAQEVDLLDSSDEQLPLQPNDEQEPLQPCDEQNQRVVGNNNEDETDLPQPTRDPPLAGKYRIPVPSNGTASSTDSTQSTSLGAIPRTFDHESLPFPELLKLHQKQFLSGFEFGEVTKRRAQANMKCARDRSIGHRLEEIITKHNADSNNHQEPGCSKTISEKDHQTPHSYKRQKLGESEELDQSTDADFSNVSRRVPRHLVDHPDCIEMWNYMVYKEEAALKLRNSRLFIDFKSVTPRMRAILLDWLMEVCEVYRLRRVTYYLSVDFFDRFLSIRPDIPKSLLQLVGITCLYIAAKVEEIYPPSLVEFSYVCDGACKTNEVVACEILVLNSLGWEVVLTTPSDWLNLYMQLHYESDEIIKAGLSTGFNSGFIYPQYSPYQFTRASQLMDLLSLDPGYLKFSYSVVAASAMYFMYDKEAALNVSGLNWRQLKPCVGYMQVFFNVLEGASDPRLESCLGDLGSEPQPTCRSRSERYALQTHVANLQYFERATIIRLSKFTPIPPTTPESAEPPAEKVYRVEDIVNNRTPVKIESDCTTDEKSPFNEAADVEDDEEADDIAASLIQDISALAEVVSEVAGEAGTSKTEPDSTEMSIDEMFELIFSQEALADI